MADTDAPSPIDFHDPAQALKWTKDTARNRPWRGEVFAAFAAALNNYSRGGLTILELGSGPGQLAEAIFAACDVQSYTALDFSDAMHALAKTRLTDHLDKVTFLKSDFRAPQWVEGLGQFDAVVTLQAAHELRHHRHLVRLLTDARKRLRPGGLFLYADHYAEADTAKSAALFLKPEEQPAALREAGFGSVTKLLDVGGLALYAAQE